MFNHYLLKCFISRHLCTASELKIFPLIGVSEVNTELTITSSYSNLCFYYICHAKMGCNQLFISGNYVIYDEMLFKMTMTIRCVSRRRMQKRIFKVVLYGRENSHGGLQTVIETPSSASDVLASATRVEDTIPQMRASRRKDSRSFPVK